MRRVLVVLVLAVATLSPARAAEIDLVAPVDGPVSRHFEQPPSPYAAGHRGLDISAPVGSLVVACASGVVAFAGAVAGTYAVSIDHQGDLRTTYSYLSSVSVKKGSSVAQGDPIGRSGAGHDAGDTPELHLGLRRGVEYLDPEPILVDSMRANLHRVLWLEA